MSGVDTSDHALQRFGAYLDTHFLSHHDARGISFGRLDHDCLRPRLQRAEISRNPLRQVATIGGGDHVSPGRKRQLRPRNACRRPFISRDARACRIDWNKSGSSDIRWGSWGESAGGEEHAEPVVVAVAEAAGEAAVQLDDPVHGLSAAVR